jgi:hypothetical protein
MVIDPPLRANVIGGVSIDEWVLKCLIMERNMKVKTIRGTTNGSREIYIDLMQ